MILSNQVECLVCGDKPYSSYRHDFKSCGCGAVAVDGGNSYLRRIGKPNNYHDISIVIPNETYHAMEAALIWAQETGRNPFGQICAVARAHRDGEFDK